MNKSITIHPNQSMNPINLAQTKVPVNEYFYIYGAVMDDNGDGYPNVCIEAKPIVPSSVSIRSTTTDAYGYFQFKLPALEYNLKASTELGSATAYVDLRTSDRRSLILTLVRPRSMQGCVAGRVGSKRNEVQHSPPTALMGGLRFA
jgi:hypothetical protein